MRTMKFIPSAHASKRMISKFKRIPFVSLIQRKIARIKLKMNVKRLFLMVVTLIRRKS